MPRILVVEDNREFSAELEDWLAGEKHEVTTVYNGSAAGDYIKSHEFDLIIMDWDLPDGTGVDLVSRFRASGSITPVIMLTGHTATAEPATALDAGASDYLTKPFHMKELSARIRAVLRTHAAAPKPAKPLGKNNEKVLRAAKLRGTALAARYELLDIMNSSASAMVLKARDPGQDKLVAVKTLFPGLFTQQRLDQFEREARVMREVVHANIARVHDHGLTERGQPYMVTDFIEGEALREKMARDKQLPLDTAVTILIQACRGLIEAHGRGIVHRDMRPENILLQGASERPDWVKLVDFAISELVTPSSLRLTRSGSTIRTASYTAPDRIDGEMADVRWDIYSLGIMLFEMLTAQVPFEAHTADMVMFSAMVEPIAPPSRYRDDIPPGSAIDELVNRATEKSPDMRHQTAREFCLELEKIQDELTLQGGV